MPRPSTVEVLRPGESRVEAPCAHYPACGGCRFQDLAYDVQVADQGAVGRRLVPAARRARRRCRSSRSSAAIASSATATRWSTRSRRRTDGPTLGLHRAGRWDEVLEIEQCLADDRHRQRDPQPPAPTGHARRSSSPTTRRRTRDTSGIVVVREGRNTGQALVQLVTARGERFDRERLIEVLTEIPAVRSIHWSENHGRRRGDEPADRAPLGRGRDRGGDRRAALPRAAERVPADEHRDGGAAVRDRPRVRRHSTGGETVYDLYCGIGTIGLSLAATALTVWGIEISEESVACAIENQELNAIGNTAFFAGNVGEVLRELRDRAGDPDVVVVDPPRAGLAGKALQAPRRARRAAHRLRLVQPDDARRRPEAPRRGLRLPARPRAAGRHVPAHAARRVRRAARALISH